jgi:hypothetical protein
MCIISKLITSSATDTKVVKLHYATESVFTRFRNDIIIAEASNNPHRSMLNINRVTNHFHIHML